MLRFVACFIGQEDIGQSCRMNESFPGQSVRSRTRKSAFRRLCGICAAMGIKSTLPMLVREEAESIDYPWIDPFVHKYPNLTRSPYPGSATIYLTYGSTPPDGWPHRPHQ